jgi:hypothetical protein
LIKYRRQKGRPVNGSADLYLNVSNRHPYKERLIEIVDEIEDSELAIITLGENSEETSIEEGRRRRQMINDLKIKANRLTEEYDEIV